MNTLSGFIPMDRRLALARGESLPDRTVGAALVADLSGFTALTAAFAGALGAQQGAEEITHALDRVFDTLIAEVHRYGGSVIGFSGDGLTCWFDAAQGGSAPRRAVTAALAMQQAMDA